MTIGRYNLIAHEFDTISVLANEDDMMQLSFEGELVRTGTWANKDLMVDPFAAAKLLQTFSEKEQSWGSTLSVFGGAKKN